MRRANPDVTDAGWMALAQGLSNSGVVSVAIDSSDTRQIGRPITKSVAPSRIKRWCVENTARRVSANDPSLTELHWTDLSTLEGGVNDNDVGRLAGKLAGNSNLQLLDLANNMKVTQRGWDTLPAPLRMSSVTSVRLKKTAIYAQAAVSAAAIRVAVVGNAVQMLSADDPSLRILMWSNFRDLSRGDFDRVMLALSGNTHLQAIELGGNQQVSDAWVDALVVALKSCSVVMAGLLTTRATANAQLSVRKALVANAVERLARNDPLLTDLTLEGPGEQGDLAAVGSSLRSNTNLRSFAAQFCTMPTQDSILSLLPPLQNSGVHRVRLTAHRNSTVTTPGSVGAATQPLQLVGAVCEKNRIQTSCLANCRVWQRLLLGAIMEWGGEPLSGILVELNFDNAMMIKEHLHCSRTCPHHGAVAKNHLLPIFPWHRSQMPLRTFEEESSSFRRKRRASPSSGKCIVS